MISAICRGTTLDRVKKQGYRERFRGHAEHSSKLLRLGKYSSIAVFGDLFEILVLVELGAVAVAWSVFFLVWSARRLKTPPAFVMLGIGCMIVGALDLLHTLAYEGMGVFPGAGADLATQLWIAARFIETAALLLFLLCFNGGGLCRWGGHALTVAAVIMLGVLFVWDFFPECFNAETGLTPFKIASEYIVMGVLAGLVDDHPAMRHGIAQLLARENDLEVCGEAGDGREALNAIAGTLPDLIVLDIALKDPDCTGLDLVSEIHASVGPVPILIYSMHDEKFYAERALRAGARGYLMKQEPVRRIIHAVRAIIKDGIYVSEEINRLILLKHIGASPERQPSVAPEDCLSEREFEVFRLIGKGLQPREIAQKLYLSTKTIETHRMNIRKKFGMANASELTRYAIDWSRTTRRASE